MSFGASVSDIHMLGKLVYGVYQRRKNACGEYAEITNLLNSAHGALRHLRKMARQDRIGGQSGAPKLTDLLKVSSYSADLTFVS